MKKLLILCLLLLIGFKSYAQSDNAFKLRVTEFNYAIIDETTKVVTWDTTMQTSVLVVVTKETITVYAKVLQNISILDTDKTKIDKEGRSYILMYCVDSDGIRVDIWLYPEVNREHIMSINYSNVIITYKCKKE